MSIHKLHIFAKNRDAIATQKGYAFQQLKTIEDWVQNRIANKDEVIYCDYEDDIFARDLKQATSKFTQVKLYSTDFSFLSDSIKKAIGHFFMLYVKGDYAFDKMEFNFETNASIVKRVVKDNDADLLQEWNDHQGKINQDLLGRIRARVKKILDEYINEMFEELKDKQEAKSDIQQARIVYSGLKDGDFDGFINCIKWQFDGVDSNIAVEQIISRIEDLIPKIQLPLDESRNQIHAALLVKEVYERSIQDDPEDRKLTNDLLDSILLNAGGTEEQWYAETLHQFKSGNEVKSFFPGEFQAVINGARYCRWNMEDDGHESFWLDLLKHCIELPDIPLPYKRKAIYEYLFLKIGHNPLEERQESAIAGDIDLVKLYIDQWEHRNNLHDIEDDITLLQLLKAQVVRFSIALPGIDLAQWQIAIEKFLDEQIQKETNVDIKCELLELRGHLAHQSNIHNPVENFKASFEFYRKIPPLLGEARFYSLAKLYGQMKALIKILTVYGIDDGLIDMVDQFMKEIQDYAERTGQRHRAAHDLVERGAIHLEHPDVSNFLKALELFHRAKELWRLEYTKEGYILSLLNIAQVYDSLGMSYASKYYALVVLWSTWHFSDPGLYKRLPHALGQICDCDYSHGAWMNAMEDFNQYLMTKREFDEKGFDMENDEMYHRSVFNIAKVFHAVPIIHPELLPYLNVLKKRWGVIWQEQIEPVVQHMNEQIKAVDSFKRILARDLRDIPLNDVGATRIVKFNALNIDWSIEFNNDETMTAIGEEFVSFLQVALCEIARINNQLLVPGQTITISIKEGHFQKENLSENSWVITIPKFDSKVEIDIQTHYGYIGSLLKSILQPASTLSKEEFTKFYMDQLLKKEDFGRKTLAGAAYQRIFRNSIGSLLSEAPDRASFGSLPQNKLTITYTNYLISTS
jgi:hypothetical protein